MRNPITFKKPKFNLEGHIERLCPIHTMSLGRKLLHGIYEGVNAGTVSLLHGVYDDECGDVDRAMTFGYYSGHTLIADKFDRAMAHAADKAAAQDAALSAVQPKVDNPTPPVAAQSSNPAPSTGSSE